MCVSFFFWGGKKHDCIAAGNVVEIGLTRSERFPGEKIFEQICRLSQVATSLG